VFFKRILSWLIIPIVLLLIIVPNISAEAFLVEYLDGIVEADEGDSWFEVYIGDELSENAIVKLSGGAFVEVSSSNTALKFSKPGTYQLKDYVTAAQSVEKANLGSLVAGRLQKMTQQSKVRTSTAVGGIRASEAVTEEATTWVAMDSVRELIDEGIGKLSEGDFNEAYWLFVDANDAAFEEDEENESRFYVGYTALLKGEDREAIEVLGGMSVDSSADYYQDYVLTLGTLYIQTLSFQEALDILSPYLELSGQEIESKQTAYLLQGLGYQGLGDIPMATTAFDKAKNLDPSSEVGTAAGEMLVNL
jgi:tetratricopeptide (TPR) repeat protein